MAVKQVVENALDEVQESITFLDLGNIILNSALLFVVLFLIVTIFNLTSFIALIPTAVYFIFHVVKAFFTNRYLRVEAQVPEMKYQLSTVADNVYRTNPIIDSLKEDLLKNMHRIRMSEFIDTKTITLKVLSLTIVSILSFV